MFDTNLKKTNPETTLVLTCLSSGHLPTAAFWRQPHIYLTGRGQASGEVKILRVT